MTELDELTEGKGINQLYYELAFHLNKGEPLAGSICSHIKDTLTQLHVNNVSPLKWNILTDKPPEDGRYLMYINTGMVISGLYTDGKFIPDITNSDYTVIYWSDIGLNK